MSGRSRIEGVLREKDAGFLAHSLLYPLSVVYGAVMRVRAVLYGLRILPSYTLGRKVVSIGNITVGGTGKTPVAIFLAGFFQKSGKKVAVLSRGYKGTARGPAIVSDGKNILLGPAEAGDEPYLMAQRLPGVPVVVCPDRVRGGRLLVDSFSPDVIILDDAFQHIRLRRDINIVLLDSVEGFGPGYTLPRGTLREPVSALRRADFALVKGGPATGAQWEALQRYYVPCMAFHYRVTVVYDIDTCEERPVSSLSGARAVVLSGIANPSSFTETVSRLGVETARVFSFPDHHSYTDREIGDIEKAASGAFVVTTEKDGVKLRGRVKGARVYALRIDVEMDQTQFDSYLSPVLRWVW